ncbi:GntR family transcriptional regulator [Pseudalkalibacillus salsuginis]|uniref:GntR family transcriptional regulator n=1 Tax=Pseudalkalibacillus salsuginis TaxID=2910972 RepID=UPI001F3E3E9A|nr:GntR family transcriptional regulator [Pseudalkalibacillus salsuginis]MCF6408342.1 GntR family transcriptional regulator [Pseudalkalibacillus salsuginis]
MINKHSSLPLYTQVERYLTTEIKNGGYHSGDLIPSERELSEKFQISRMTVRQAINNLVNKGILYRERGKGTFVAAPKIGYQLKGIVSFSEDMRRRGLEPSTKVVSFKTMSNPPEHILNRLACRDEKKVIQLVRIRFANEEPVAIETAYLSYNLFANLSEKDTGGSIYDFVRKELKLEIHRAEQQIEAAIVGEKDGFLLDISPGSPVLIVNRTTYLSNGVPFETVKTVFRADRYHFSIEMKNEQEDDHVFSRD